jgi:hypothetical protein
MGGLLCRVCESNCGIVESEVTEGRISGYDYLEEIGIKAIIYG